LRINRDFNANFVSHVYVVGSHQQTTEGRFQHLAVDDSSTRCNHGQICHQMMIDN